MGSNFSGLFYFKLNSLYLRPCVTPRDRCARCRLVICCCCHVIACVSCIAYHAIMCISFAYMFVSCIRAFSLLSVLQSGGPMSPGVPFYFFSCAGVKRFRIGLRLVMQPWFTTGRPPVKFRAIWTSFDTPTVNRGTVKASCVLQPNTPPKWPKTPPSSRSFDHDHVAENHAQFGAS